MFSSRHALLTTLALLFILALAGCGSDQGNNETVEAEPAPAQGQQPAGHAPVPAAVPGAFVSGTIVETMDSGGYTYVLLDTGDSRVWVAGPQTAGLEVGEKVSAPDGMEMKNFRANSLDRTFASILFVGSLHTGDAPAAASDGHGGGMGGMPGMMGHGGGEKGGSEKGVNANAIVAKAQVERLDTPAGGHSVADIYAQAGKLGGKSVKLRGQVVKFSPNIMGTNWVHIQDGSGDAETSDLTVTTDATVAVGDIVLVEGALSVDKDFGAGYKYHVIVEKAQVTKE